MRATSLVVVAALVGLGTTARAQSFAVDHGSWLVAGTAGANSQGFNSQQDRTLYLFFAPSVQYFVVPGLALGGTLALARSSSGDSHVTSYGVGPAATYYFGRGSRPVYAYVGGSAMLTRNYGVGTSTGNQLGARTGLVFMLARNVGVDAGLYYDRYRSHSRDFSDDMSVYGLDIGVAAFVF